MDQGNAEFFRAVGLDEVRSWPRESPWVFLEGRLAARHVGIF